jgi:hypothetical protein
VPVVDRLIEKRIRLTLAALGAAARRALSLALARC